MDFPHIVVIVSMQNKMNEQCHIVLGYMEDMVKKDSLYHHITMVSYILVYSHKIFNFLSISFN